MPKPFKLQDAKPLPAGAEIVDHEGRPHVRMKVNGRSVLFPLSKDGRKYLRPSARWYFKIRDENGQIVRVKGERDLKATEAMAANFERRVGRARAGYNDPALDLIIAPLADHLRDYAGHLEAKGGTIAHIKQTVGRINMLLNGCGFVFLKDVDVSTATDWLNRQRRDGSPISIPEGDTFTPGKTAQLLGISGAAVRATIKRLNLSATGHGKKRLFPRATVEVMARERAKGVSPETQNHYLRAARGFFRWLARRTGANPLESLALVNTAADIRHARRELTGDELARLFIAARESVRIFRGLSGRDRFHLYLLAASSGFRASALSELTPADFAFDQAGAVVTLAARFNKSRKVKEQPLPADVAETLKEYFISKAPDKPIWGGTWARDHRGAEMLRIDLAAAGIPYRVSTSDGPEFADFHSLRHSYLTLGGRAGIDLRTLQALAGHSKPELTARYSHRRLHDLAGAVDKLPPLVPPTTAKPDETPLRMTGTDVKSGVPAVPPAVLAVPPAVPARRIGRHQSARLYTVYRGLKEKGKGAEIDVNP